MNSPDVVTGMIKVFTSNAYAFLDQLESLSFVTPYVANQFEFLPQKHCEPFYVPTYLGESILTEKVYHDFPIPINNKTSYMT